MKPRLFNSHLANLGARFAGVPIMRSAVRDASFPTPSQEAAADGGGAPYAPASSSIQLSDSLMILVGAIAAYERCTPDEAVSLALCEYAERIGCSPLARAVALRNERRLDGDLTDVPEMPRGGFSRFARAKGQSP